MKVSVAIMPVCYNDTLHSTTTLLKKYSDTEYGLAEVVVPDDQNLDDYVRDVLINELKFADSDIIGISQVHTFGGVDRDKDERVVSVLYVIGLISNVTTSLAEDVTWFETNSGENKVTLSIDDEDVTIIAYRDGRSIGDATLIRDHTNMITFTM